MKEKLSKGLSLSVNPKHSQESAFFAVTEFFADSFRKFNKIINHAHKAFLQESLFSTSDASPFVKNDGNKGLSTNIFKHTLNVILGFIPRIHAKHSPLLDTLVEPEYDGNGVDISTPEYDGKRSLVKGLDVVCQYAALLERRVQSSTRVRKAQAVTRQTNPIGRSMIEMLGVLAIIGVLSVGGIAGYSKAMTKFKINKTMQQIAEIATNVQTLYMQQKDCDGLTNKTAIQMGVIPDDLNTLMHEYYADVKNAFGGDIEIECWSDTYRIAYYDMTKEACMALATADWGSISSLGLLGVGINDTTEVMNSSGGYDCNNSTTYDLNNTGYFACSKSLPIPPTVAAQYCGKREDSNAINGFVIFFKK